VSFDPWAGVAPAEAWRRVIETDAAILLSAGSEEEMAEAAAAAAAQVEKAKAEGATLQDAAVFVAAADADLTDAALSTLASSAAAQGVVVCDVSGNALGGFPSAATPALRSLSLAGNPLSPVPTLALPLLVSLDLSYVEMGDDGFAALKLSGVPGLRRLTLEGCGLSTLGPAGEGPLAAVAGSLLELVANENELEELDSLAALAQLRAVRIVDLRENPVCEEAGYEDEVKKLCPLLLELDTSKLKTGRIAALGELEGLAAAMAATDTVADQNEDNGSCSCLEGNACLTPETCKDWAHRFAIAAAVRKEAGVDAREARKTY